MAEAEERIKGWKLVHEDRYCIEREELSYPIYVWERLYRYDENNYTNEINVTKNKPRMDTYEQT